MDTKKYQLTVCVDTFGDGSHKLRLLGMRHDVPTPRPYTDQEAFDLLTPGKVDLWIGGRQFSVAEFIAMPKRQWAVELERDGVRTRFSPQQLLDKVGWPNGTICGMYENAETPRAERE